MSVALSDPTRRASRAELPAKGRDFAGFTVAQNDSGCVLQERCSAGPQHGVLIPPLCGEGGAAIAASGGVQGGEHV